MTLPHPPQRASSGYPWRRIPGRARQHLRYLTAPVIGHRSYEIFALLGHARTGSNFVLNGLITSRAIRMYDEIFAAHSRSTETGFEDVWATVSSRQPRSVRAVGFKLFYYHLSAEEWSKFVEEPILGVVHLTRRNRLRTLVSLAIATKTNRWTGTAGIVPLDEKRVLLDVSNLARQLDEIEEGEESARRQLHAGNVLEVVYEDIVAEPDHEFGRIGRFLGVADIDPSRIVLPRQNPEPLSSLIENFDDVAECVAKTRYAHYLAG